MEKSRKIFLNNVTHALKIAFLGFSVVALGVFLGFLGFTVGRREISIAGFFICNLGAIIFFFGMALGWIKDGPKTFWNIYIHYIKKRGREKS